MKDFDALIVNSVSEIDPRLWGIKDVAHPFSSYAWYAFCEKTMPECSPVHILLFRDGCTFARGSYWLMWNDALPISSPLGRKAAEWMIKHKPLLVCRSPVANVSGLVLPETGRRDALIGLMETAEAYAKSTGVSFILYDYLNPQEVKTAVLPERYATMQVTEPGTALNIRWRSYEDFLASLPKPAWKDYRRHINQAARLGIRVRMYPAATDLTEALSLIHRVEKHHGVMPNPWTREIIENMDVAGGIWMEARQNDQLIGCGLLLRDGDHLVATLMGLDYNIKYAYFPLVYCAVQYAIENGLRVFHAGSGAYELKQRLGFTLEKNNHIAFTGIGPVFSTAVRVYNSGQKREKQYIEEGLRC
jgi:predicted N-acyltransferase